ncbi:MAG: hypothetical protein KDC24_12490 [Saprospiraceae bacterium]|nr:hypothetical protein [Saprospiraceae bacterium]
MRATTVKPFVKSLSFYALLAGFTIISFRFYHESRWDLEKTNGVLNWDVLGYYMYLPSTFIYKDITKLDFVDSLKGKYNWPGDFYQAYTGPNGNKIFKYPIGTAVLNLPAFGVAQIWASNSEYPGDGFSQSYQTVISIWGWLIAFIGLLFTRKVLLEYFTEGVTAMVLVILCLGTNYYQYTSFDFTSPHNYLFTILAILIWLTIRFYENPSFLKAIVIGLLCGVAALTRPTDLVFILIPVLWGAGRGKDHWVWLQKQGAKISVATLVVTLVGFLQLAYWKYVSGDWIVYSYEEQGFSFLSPHISNVLYSYRKGWLIYTPLMTFSIIGMYFLYKNKRPLFLPIGLLFLVHFWIVASWDIWWYGGGWGQRAMIDIYPALAFPMAAFLGFSFKKRWTTYIGAMVTVAGIVLNLFMIHQANLDTEYTTPAFFKKVFLATSVTEQDLLLKDTDEYFKGEPKATQQIFLESFDTKTDTSRLTREKVKSGTYATWVGPGQEFSETVILDANKIGKDWTYLRCKADFYTPAKESSFWAFPQFMVTFFKNDEPIKQKLIRVQRILPPETWKTIYFDTKIPKKDFDRVQIHLYAAGCQGKTFMDEVGVEGMR